MLIYPVDLAPDDNDTVLVTFPDVPEGVTYGETEKEALFHAIDALEVIFMAYMDDKRPIPMPSPAKGRHTIALSALTTAKVLLYNALLKSRMTKTNLARLMGCHPPQIERLLDLGHESRMDLIEKALAALGLQLLVDVKKAAPLFKVGSHVVRLSQ